jgi:hypothetical protein
VLSRTEVDGEGTEYDAERVSESRRDFKQPPELRRLVKYRQGIAIIDTADPILFRFLPRADNGDVAVPTRRLLDPPQTLAEAVQVMTEIKQAQKLSNAVHNNGHDKHNAPMVSNPETDSGQPDQSETKPPEEESRIFRSQVRAGAFENELLPFETHGEESRRCRESKARRESADLAFPTFC